MSTTKVPTDERPLVQDPDLAAALERELRPLNGERLERAQAAVRTVRNSGLVGTFDQVLEVYRAAITKAAGSVRGRGESAGD